MIKIKLLIKIGLFFIFFCCSSSLKMKNKIEIDIAVIENKAKPSSNTLAISITNSSPRSIWLVNDAWFKATVNTDTIELSFAREIMNPNTRPFGYFLPLLKELKTGESYDRKIELNWPQRLSLIWNSISELNPPKGKYQIKIVFGYGTKGEIKIGKQETAEEAILKWQKKVTLEDIQMTIIGNQ